MGIIANWTALSNKGITVSNITDYTQCPTKSSIIANTNAFLFDSSSYASNQLMKLSNVYGPSEVTIINYVGVGDTVTEAYDSSDTGTLYLYNGITNQGGSIYYADNTGTILAAEGVYMITRGTIYPECTDSTYITITQ